MQTGGVLLALFSPPVATLVAYLGLSGLSWLTYVLGDAKDDTKVAGRTVQRLRRWTFRSWWRTIRAFSRQSKGRAAMKAIGIVFFVGIRIALAAACGYLAAFVVWLPLIRIRAIISGPTAGWQVEPNDALVILSCLGVLFGIVSLIDLVRYSTSVQRPHFWSPPTFSLPAGAISTVDRFDFNRRIWLYTWLRRNAYTASLLGPFLSLAALVTITNEPSKPEESLPLLLVLAGFWITSYVRGLLVRLAAATMPVAYAAVAVHQCLQPSTSHRTTTRRWGVVDQLGERRDLLARASRGLEIAGRRIDLTADHHPIASILRGCARQLHGYLGRVESLSDDYPPVVTSLLNKIIIELAGPADQRFHTHLGNTVGAFGNDGSPLASLRTESSRRWTSFATRIADTIDPFARLGTAAWTLFTLIVVVILIVTGVLDLSKIQLQK